MADERVEAEWHRSDDGQREVAVFTLQLEVSREVAGELAPSGKLSNVGRCYIGEALQRIKPSLEALLRGAQPNRRFHLTVRLVATRGEAPCEKGTMV